jgi:hypothetical protein
MAPAMRSVGERTRLARRALWITATLAAGCGQPSLSFIAGAASDAGQVADDPGRGRVQVAGISVVTDKGTVLRAIDLPIDVTPAFPLGQTLFEDIAHVEGLNAVQVYLEHWAEDTGSNAAQADAIVDETRRAGLYAVLGIGGGPPGDGHPGNGWFDIDKVRSFWQFYAPRYKDQAHVIFQIQNQPESSCDAVWQPDTIAMEREAYSLIRSLAPLTHIILFSYGAVPTPALLGDSVDRVSDIVDWAKASVGVGALATCASTAQFIDTFSAAAARQTPISITAMPTDNWAPTVIELEKNRVGWTSMRWLAVLPDFANFQMEHAQANVSWCPDFGTWPEDSATCAH